MKCRSPETSEEDDHRTTRKERTKRVVVPLADTPENVIAGLHQACELMDSSVLEAYSFGTRARKNRNGEASDAAEVWRPVGVRD
jgi:hypothetical protein